MSVTILMKVRRLKKGMEVWWDDPDMGKSSGYYKIIDCPDDIDIDSVITISDGNSEAEVLLHELTTDSHKSN